MHIGRDATAVSANGHRKFELAGDWAASTVGSKEVLAIDLILDVL